MKIRTALAAFVLAIAAPILGASGEDLRKLIPAPRLDPASNAATETAVLAGGCFWGVQGVFAHVKGVDKVVSGYSGGSKATAFYPMVTTETTGHAEAVQITFNPKVISFGQLLQIYFSVVHDPTQFNRQGPDEGPSYRSQIFAVTPQQEKIANAYIAQLDQARIFPGSIVTRVEPLKAFYEAEPYHQDYLFRNPRAAYIVVNDLPKIEALKKVWPQYYRPDPVRIARN